MDSDKIEVLTAEEAVDRQKALTTQKEKNPVYQYMISLSEGSRRGQMMALRAALAALDQIVLSEAPDEISEGYSAEAVYAFPWGSLSYGQVNSMLGFLKDHFKPAYCNKILAAVKRVLKEERLMGKPMISHDEFFKIIENVKSVPIPDEELAGRYIERDEQNRLMAALMQDASPVGVRDAAVILLGLGCGLRISEVSNLRFQDFNIATCKVTVFEGKNKKTATVPIWNAPLEALKGWIEIRGDGPGPMFCPISRTGEIMVGEPFGESGIRDLLEKRQKEAGLQEFTFHDLRRSFVTDLLYDGGDPLMVSKLARHKSIQTTLKYDRRSEEDRERLIRELRHIEYELPTKNEKDG